MLALGSAILYVCNQAVVLVVSYCVADILSPPLPVRSGRGPFLLNSLRLRRVEFDLSILDT